MSELLIRMTRHAGGGSTLHCDRADGTVTCQTRKGKQASVFPLHDVVHYAVETQLCFRPDFYGLIAEAWDIADTAGKGPRGPLPAETLIVEHTVGFLLSERACSAVWTAEEFNSQMDRISGANARQTPRRVSDDDLVWVRSTVHDLFSLWNATAPLGMLELRFDRGCIPVWPLEPVDKPTGSRTV